MADIPAISGVDDPANVRVMLLQGKQQVNAPLTGLGFLPLDGSLPMTGDLTVQSVDGGAAAGPFIRLNRLSPTPAVNDVGAEILWQFNNASLAAVFGAAILPVLTDPTAGTEDVQLQFYNMVNGAAVQEMALVAGQVNIYRPLDISGAAAGQVLFPASQNASAGANTLDDYEEGTFTPRIDGTTAAGAGTYSVQNGIYTKVGRAVQWSATVTWSAHTGTGNMIIANLPFSAAATHDYPVALVPSNLVAANPLYGKVLAGTSTVQLGTAASGLAFTALAIDAAATIQASGGYCV